MYSITLILVLAVLFVWSEGPGVSVFLVGIPILFICGVYVYVDMRIMIKGEDEIEKEDFSNLQKPVPARAGVDDEVAELQSGRVNVFGNFLTYSFKGEEVVKIDLNRVKLIGEFTTNEGPYVDDWFIVFFYDQEEGYQITMYAAGMQAFLSEQGKERWGENVLPHLYYSTTWRSRIVWPVFDEDIDLWDKEVVKPEDGMKAIKYVFGFREYKLSLSPTAITALKRSVT